MRRRKWRKLKMRRLWSNAKHNLVMLVCLLSHLLCSTAFLPWERTPIILISTPQSYIPTIFTLSFHWPFTPHFISVVNVSGQLNHIYLHTRTYNLAAQFSTCTSSLSFHLRRHQSSFSFFVECASSITSTQKDPASHVTTFRISHRFNSLHTFFRY